MNRRLRVRSSVDVRLGAPVALSLTAKAVPAIMNGELVDMQAARRAALIPTEPSAPAPLVAVNSRVLKSVGFQSTRDYRGTLTVVFHTGRTYQYADVPLGLYEDFLEARSLGVFFNERIRGQFTATEITDTN